MIIPKDAPAIAPAPAPEWARVHQVPVRECGQPLVPLSLAPERILVRPAYHVAGIPGALPECHAREEVQKRLWAAQALLPPFLRLVILDAWRGVRVQTALYDQCRAALARAHPGADAAALDEMTGRFVALPSVEPGRPSPHVTGGAVDLTLATVAGAPLWFGAAFDFPGPVSFTRTFEERLDAGETLDDRGRTALENRRCCTCHDPGRIRELSRRVVALRIRHPALGPADRAGRGPLRRGRAGPQPLRNPGRGRAVP